MRISTRKKAPTAANLRAVAAIGVPDRAYVRGWLYRNPPDLQPGPHRLGTPTAAQASLRAWTLAGPRARNDATVPRAAGPGSQLGRNLRAHLALQYRPIG